MADTKISALPAVAVPAVGDEFACNQAGVTKKETKAQITAATDANLTAHIAVTAAGVHGSSAATANDTLVHRSAAGDADATAFNAGAGAVGTPAHTFTADPNTGLYNANPNELGITTNGARRGIWNATGALILGDAAASTFMTGPGVTIQQGALDNEAFAAESTDVAHGITDYADTDTYYQILKFEGASGGVLIRGLKDADGIAGGAAILAGMLGESADTTKTTAGRAIVEAIGYIKSGTGIGNTNADGNVFGVRTWRGGAEVTVLLVDEDGDVWVDGTVDTIDVANHVHTGGAMGPLLTAAGITNRTRDLWVGALATHPSAGSSGAVGTNVSVPYYEWQDAMTTRARSSVLIPADWDSGNVTIKLYWRCSAAAGNGRFELDTLARANGEDMNAVAELSVVGDYATAGANLLNVTQLSNAVPVAAGDFLGLMLGRLGGHGNDTLDTDLQFLGYELEYTADS